MWEGVGFEEKVNGTSFEHTYNNSEVGVVVVGIMLFYKKDQASIVFVWLDLVFPTSRVVPLLYYYW